MKNILFIIAGIVLLGNIFLNVQIFQASASFQSGLDNTAKGSGYAVPTDKPDIILYKKIGMVINISTTFVGVAFLGLMIYAGAVWMFARGNEQEVAKAKNIIIYAIVGLVVVLSAYAITTIFNTLWISAKAE